MGYNKSHVKILDPKDGYDLLGSEYKKHWKWLDSFYKIDFNRFVGKENIDINILDLGAGDGRLWKYLSKLKYKKYVACDISEKLLFKHPGKVDKVVCDLQSILPFEDGLFGLTTSFFVVEHLADLHIFFSEVYRVLSVGGIFIVGYFLQRREFLWKLNGMKFKIKMYKHKIEYIKETAENCFFDVSFDYVFEKSELIGYIIICEKNNLY